MKQCSINALRRRRIVGYQGPEMARRSDHTREELRRLILQAARRIIRDKGVAALSARKVASDIGYTVGTIYQHFNGMDAILITV